MKTQRHSHTALPADRQDHVTCLYLPGLAGKNGECFFGTFRCSYESFVGHPKSQYRRNTFQALVVHDNLRNIGTRQQ